MDEPRNITLIGFMGSGKSTIGRLLAKKLRWRFVDTDDVIVRAAGRSIPTIFAEDGEAAFRRLETEAVVVAAQAEQQVIASGGGVVLDSGNVETLRTAGLVVWLTVRPEIVAERTRRRAAERPLLASSSPDLLEHILCMLAERGPLYQAAADFIVDASDRTPSAICAEIERKARRWQPGRG